MLAEKKEFLDEQKRQGEESNDDLTRQVAAREEANQKRLIAKLQRDKNPQVKELLKMEQDQQETNESFGFKFTTEREKHDKLLDELL